MINNMIIISTFDDFERLLKLYFPFNVILTELSLTFSSSLASYTFYPEMCKTTSENKLLPALSENSPKISSEMSP